ncbi:thiamine diphosphokinase [Proteiniclasticum sp. C24MP]|uniref:thiamine diphosphokinase n=1 Tax=Proteiniclasticum sp. C24MP TaxID=3374101 RepID=UPI003753F8F3
MKKVIIVSGGKKPSLSLYESLYDDTCRIIAVDSGAEFFRENGITPHVLLGDFDSITEETLRFFEGRTEVIRYDTVKDFTDTEAALEEAFKEKPDEIVLLGCTGNRLDHFIGNLSLLEKALRRSVKAFIMDDHNKIFMMDKPGIIKKEFGDYISFQAFRGPVKGFGVKGVKYPLWDYELVLGDSMNVSNEFVEKYISVTFQEGILMVFMTKD